MHHACATLPFYRSTRAALAHACARRGFMPRCCRLPRAHTLVPRTAALLPALRFTARTPACCRAARMLREHTHLCRSYRASRAAAVRARTHCRIRIPLRIHCACRAACRTRAAPRNARGCLRTARCCACAHRSALRACRAGYHFRYGRTPWTTRSLPRFVTTRYAALPALCCLARRAYAARCLCQRRGSYAPRVHRRATPRAPRRTAVLAFALHCRAPCCWRVPVAAAVLRHRAHTPTARLAARTHTRISARTAARAVAARTLRARTRTHAHRHLPRIRTRRALLPHARTRTCCRTLHTLLPHIHTHYPHTRTLFYTTHRAAR